jgi:hypothetical protein
MIPNIDMDESTLFSYPVPLFPTVTMPFIYFQPSSSLVSLRLYIKAVEGVAEMLIFPLISRLSRGIDLIDRSCENKGSDSGPLYAKISTSTDMAVSTGLKEVSVILFFSLEKRNVSRPSNLPSDFLLITRVVIPLTIQSRIILSPITISDR